MENTELKNHASEITDMFINEWTERQLNPKQALEILATNMLAIVAHADETMINVPVSGMGMVSVLAEPKEAPIEEAVIVDDEGNEVQH